MAAKWVLPDPNRARALEIFYRRATGEIELIAPDILPLEFASLVSKRARRKELTHEHARRAVALFRASSPVLCETHLILADALELSLRHELSLWDSVYVALAVSYGCPVLTADKRLFRSGAGRHHALRLID